MKQFEFKLYGGFTVTFEKETVTIDVKGVKGLFFQRIKPRNKTIPYQDIVQIDYKDAGRMIGYIRFLTTDTAKYASSQYVAEVDENSIIFEKDENEIFEEMMHYLHKKMPQIEKFAMKM